MRIKYLAVIFVIIAAAAALAIGTYFIRIRKTQEPPASRPLLLVSPPTSPPKIKGPSGPPPR